MSNKLRLLILALYPLFFLGCATPETVKMTEQSVDEIDMRLASSADRIATSMATLSIVEQSARGIHAQAITPESLPEDLTLSVSLDYAGNIEPLLMQLAATIGYKLEVYGRRSKVVPVQINVDQREVGMIFADLDYQTSWRCDVFVIPDRKLVELRYHRRRPEQV